MCCSLHAGRDNTDHVAEVRIPGQISNHRGWVVFALPARGPLWVWALCYLLLKMLSGLLQQRPPQHARALACSTPAIRAATGEESTMRQARPATPGSASEAGCSWYCELGSSGRLGFQKSRDSKGQDQKVYTNGFVDVATCTRYGNRGCSEGGAEASRFQTCNSTSKKVNNRGVLVRPTGAPTRQTQTYYPMGPELVPSARSF